MMANRRARDSSGGYTPNMSTSPTDEQIKEWSGEFGFDLTGIAPALPIDHADSLHRYVSLNNHGEMTFLARNPQQRTDPRAFLPWARSIICTATNYYPGQLTEPPQPSDAPVGRIARYACRSDYHVVIKNRLGQLADRIRQAATDPVRLRVCVDTAPLAEKAHAARAGLGWIGKNTLLVNEQLGSYLLLGEIVTDLPLTSDEPGVDRCGDCRRCLDACPTRAMCQPRHLDARRCISYLTIEASQAPPAELTRDITPWVFGCDRCQEACPYNADPPVRDDPDWPAQPECLTIDINTACNWTESEFKARFDGTPVLRSSWPRLQALLDARAPSSRVDTQ